MTDELQIEDNPVGELGFVDGRLGAKKHPEHETTKEPTRLPVSNSTSVSAPNPARVRGAEHGTLRREQ